MVKVFIGPDGVPTEATVEGCPSVFHEHVRSGILAWRWYPPKDRGTAVWAQTTIGVTLKLVPQAP